MAKKKKSISAGIMTPPSSYHGGDYFAASQAAREAIDNHPNVSELRHGLTKALDGTIRRFFSHKPMLKKKKR